MKKLISLLLALCLSVSLAACQGKSDIDENAYDKGEGLLAFPVNTGTANSAIKAKSPLIVMVDDPMVSMSAKAFTIPLTSSTNLIFTDKEKLEEELEKSSISSYIEDVKGISLEME